MLLTQVSMFGYKSFRKETHLHVSPRTTVLIGPNDHGKTNALSAVRLLDLTQNFTEADINDRPESHTQVMFGFHLEADDLTHMESGLNAIIDGLTPSETSDSAGASEALEGQSVVTDVLMNWWKELTTKRLLVLTRMVGTDILDIALPSIPSEVNPALRAQIVMELLKARPPTVFFFSAEVLRQLPETVDVRLIETNDVMQGVFKLAGIWDQRKEVLSQNIRKNSEVLRVASKTLTDKIRENWTQGKDLEFFLEYEGNNIRLSVKDNARTVTAVGERSAGFTSYFAMRMLLVARTDQAKPNGYVFIFDEPGLNLHPKGQVDLQNVFEDLAKTNQIIYSTHSVFLINKNFPDRNHLVFKDEHGSHVDSKPFAGGWAKVKEHLGLYLSANFLFSDAILFAEGPTDEILLPTILAGLIEGGLFRGDMNALAIRSSLNVKQMIGLADMYTRERRTVLILVDGDGEGKQREKQIKEWIQSAKVEKLCTVITLDQFKKGPCSIEDFLEPAIYEAATLAALKEAAKEGIIKPIDDTWEANWKTEVAKGTDTQSLGKRVEAATKALFNDTISDVWIARKYVESIAYDPANPYWREAANLKLADAIWSGLKLPLRGDAAALVFTPR